MIAAPFAGMLLGDLGADVIKVEPPGGESWRLTGQFAPTESRPFIAINRNKRGLVINLKTPEGQAIVHRMIPDIDVVIVNYRPGTPKTLGIDYECLRDINPQIVYVDNTAMGSRGPAAHRPGYDLVVQAMTGLMATGGRKDAAGTPLPLSPPIADLSTGLTIAWAVCAGLYARERNGMGQHIETSLMATALAFQGTGFMRMPEVTAAAPAPSADDGAAEGTGAGRRSVNAYYRTYVTKDSMIAVAALNPVLRRKFADAVGVPDVRHTDRTLPRTGPEARKIAEDYVEAVEKRMLELTTEEWLECFDAAMVPAGPFRRVADLVDDPQVLANDLQVEVEHPVAKTVHMVGPLIRMSETPTTVRNASPTLGQHTDEILASLGLSEDRIAKLREQGVVA